MRKFKDIAAAAQAAAALEASSEKPGNVTPTHDFADASYADYLAGSIAIGSCIEAAAQRGFAAGRTDIPPADIGIGELILAGATDISRSHAGGNTHLGTLMLLVPIAAAAGMCIAQKKGFAGIRQNVREVIRKSTKKDSRNLYRAIRKARPGGLGKLEVKEAPFSRLMRMSAKKDRVAEELSGGMKIIFEIGLPALEKSFKATGDIRAAAAETYMTILSRFPDTLIAKKCGVDAAKDVSSKAQAVIEGSFTVNGFDGYLRSRGNALNPGTTADIVSATLFVWKLKKIL